MAAGVVAGKVAAKAMAKGSMKAAANSGPEVRMSRPSTNVPPARPNTRTKAAPMARAPSASHSGLAPVTVPRMSLALNMDRVSMSAA